MNYVCKIPNIEEMNTKWDYEIEHAVDDKNNWIVWKKENLDRFTKGLIIPYYGLLDGQIICECTAIIDSSIIQNPEDIIDEKTAYLSAFK